MEFFVAVVIRITGSMTNLSRNKFCKDATQYNFIIEELTRDILIPTIFVNHFLLQAFGTFFWAKYLAQVHAKPNFNFNFWNAALKSCRHEKKLLCFYDLTM